MMSKIGRDSTLASQGGTTTLPLYSVVILIPPSLTIRFARPKSFSPVRLALLSHHYDGPAIFQLEAALKQHVASIRNLANGS